MSGTLTGENVLKFNVQKALKLYLKFTLVIHQNGLCKTMGNTKANTKFVLKRKLYYSKF